ncbi:MAG: carboxypeptidase-like regulatory domain-containing protein [Arcticibacter sp.]
MKAILCFLRSGTYLFFLLICFFLNRSYAQTKISGQVSDATDKETLPGVSVTVKGTSTGTATDTQGKFTITASPGQVLIFKYIGYNDQQVTVGANPVLNVQMSSSTKSLEEVVVIGYGTQKKGSLTGAVATFNADNLEERPVQRVDQAMVGQMAGVNVKQTTGSPGKGMSVQV